MGAKSHRISMMPIVKGLAERGHNVTVVSPNKWSEVIEGVREIQVKSIFVGVGGTSFNWFEMNENSGVPKKTFDIFKNLVNTAFKPMFTTLMDNQEFHQLLKDHKVDLVIIDDSFHDFTLPVIEELIGAPFILHSASTGYPWSWAAVGASQELASVPGRMSRFNNEMAFHERLSNTLITSIMMGMRNWYMIPALDEAVKERLPNARSISAIQNEASLLFFCSKFATSWPRPLPPTAIPLGPLHVRPALPLPQNFHEYVKEAGEDGFIIFTLGSVSSSEFMPKKHVDTFLKTFARLPQKVVWKWDSDKKPANVPSNVLLAKWLPQQDLLGQPNARLFITHGGLLGMQESLYHGVPLLALPFATDQYMNAAKGMKEGCSLKLEWKELDEEKLFDAITTIVNNPSFKGNATRLSSIMRDQLVSGKDTAVYWVEHVIKHNGTKHLKLASQDMPFYQYYLLDVVLFVTAIGLVVTAVLVYILVLLKRLVRRLVCGAPKSGTDHLKSQ